VSDPSPATATPADWQRWQVTITEPWPAPEEAEAAISWRTEGLVALVVVACSAVLGGLVGLVWPRVAPHIHVVPAVNGSEAATKALLGDDMWLALLGAIAGVVSVVLLAFIARDTGSGPGAVVGLAIGGLLGSIVAARVGHLVEHPHIVIAIRAGFPGITPHSVTAIVGYFDFRVRARAVLVAWPLTAVALHAVLATLRHRQLAGRHAGEPR
jgi:membrane protein YqaA with SNARE-associated domain